MKTARRLTTAAMFFTALALATPIRAQSDPAPAAEPVLKAIPDNALGLVLVKNLAQTDKAITKLAAAIQVPAPSALSMFKSQAGIQAGLDENGSAAVAIVPGTPTQSRMPFLFLPVTDYDKFIAQLQPDDAKAKTTGVTIAGHSLIAGRKNSFAVFTLPGHKEELEKVLAATKGVDSLLGSFEPWIGRHQVSVIATPTGSKMMFQISLATLKQAQASMKQFQNAKQSAQIGAIMDMYVEFLTKARQEVDAIGIGLNVDDNSNVSIDSHTKFVGGGDWAAAMKGLKPSDGKVFSGIQAAPFLVAFDGIWPKEWSSGMAKFSATMLGMMSAAGGGAEMNAQDQKTYGEAMQSMMQGLQSMSLVMAAPKPGGSMYDGMAGTMRVDDAASFLARYQKSMEQLRDVAKKVKMPFYNFSEVKKIELDGHSGLAITMDMSGMLGAGANPASAKAMSLIVGPTGKLTMRILVADEHTLVAAYGSEEHAKEALAAFKNPKSSFASDPDVAATLKLLPPHAQWIGLVSINGYMDLIMGIMPAIAPPGAAPINLPKLPRMPAIGFAAEAGHGGLDTQMVVPVETMSTLGTFIRGAMSHGDRPAQLR